MTQDIPFGVHSEVGQLRKVMVCAPGRAHQRLTPSNCDDLLFDDVLWVDNAWSWNTEGPNAASWERLHTLGKTMGLEPLRFETPHLQLAGLSISALRSGKFPDCGHDPWRDNLEGAIISWIGKPPAPPIASLRPALPAESQTHS